MILTYCSLLIPTVYLCDAFMRIGHIMYLGFLILDYLISDISLMHMILSFFFVLGLTETGKRLKLSLAQRL